MSIFGFWIRESSLYHALALGVVLAMPSLVLQLGSLGYGTTGVVAEGVTGEG